MPVLYRHCKWALPKDVGGRAKRPQHLDPQEWSRRRSPDQGQELARPAPVLTL